MVALNFRREPPELDDWRADLHHTADRGDFLFSVNRYVCVGRGVKHGRRAPHRISYTDSATSPTDQEQPHRGGAPQIISLTSTTDGRILPSAQHSGSAT